MIKVQASDLASWCRVYLGSTVSDTLFTAGHLSVVVGVRLVDGRQVVVKVRPNSPRIAGCVEVQRQLHDAGFPCPEPLVGPSPFTQSLLATAEAYVGGGTQLDPAASDRPAQSAKALADLVSVTQRSLRKIPSLDPPPPWAWPDPDALWPRPDDLDADLNTHEGPGWLDELGGGVSRRLLLAHHRTPVIGHADFESQNIRWMADGRSLHVVHDWDSVAALPEPAMAGVASAIFTRTGEEATEATVEESRLFLECYQADRALDWSQAEQAVAWAGGLWVRAFDAKKAYVRGDPIPAERLRSELPMRISKLMI